MDLAMIKVSKKQQGLHEIIVLELLGIKITLKK